MNCDKPIDGGPMISPTRTSHASALPISSRASVRVENVTPSFASLPPAATPPFAPSPDEHPLSPNAESAATPASAVKLRRVIIELAIYVRLSHGKALTEATRGKPANVCARINHR